MQITQKFWAIAEPKMFEEQGRWDLRLLNWSPKNLPEYLLIRSEPYEITVDIPEEFNLRDLQADGIRAEIRKIQAETQNKITELTVRLNSILAIEG